MVVTYCATAPKSLKSRSPPTQPPPQEVLPPWFNEADTVMSCILLFLAILWRQFLIKSNSMKKGLLDVIGRFPVVMRITITFDYL